MHSVNTHWSLYQRMKVVPTKTSTSNCKTGFLPPPIPLQQALPKTLQKDDYLTMKLHSIPKKASSPVYKLNVPYFKNNGTPEEWLKFLQNFKKIIIGQDLTTSATQFAMAQCLLTGKTLSQFNKKSKELLDKAFINASEGEAITEEDIETTDNVMVCMQAVTLTVLPQKALQTQKQYMHRVLHKPKDMKI